MLLTWVLFYSSYKDYGGRFLEDGLGKEHQYNSLVNALHGKVYRITLAQCNTLKIYVYHINDKCFQLQDTLASVFSGSLNL